MHGCNRWSVHCDWYGMSVKLAEGSNSHRWEVKKLELVGSNFSPEQMVGVSECEADTGEQFASFRGQQIRTSKFPPEQMSVKVTDDSKSHRLQVNKLELAQMSEGDGLQQFASFPGHNKLELAVSLWN